MSTKTKIFIGALIFAAFVLGGFALNAYKAEALKAGTFFFHKFGIDKEGWKAKKEEWKEMTPEEHKAKMEGLKFGDPFGLFKKFGDEVNHEVITLDNGIQVTITSDNSDIVQKLHDFVEKFNE